jgi:hypothetical protein
MPVHTQYEPGAPAEQAAPPVAALPSSDEEWPAPWQRDWMPTHVWVSDVHVAAEPATDQTATALPADTSVEWPALAPLAAPAPIEHAQVLESDQWENEQTVRGSTVLSPAETYISTPSRNLRRRVMQRVIVRKMAVLDGHVVAESTAERQVAVVPDEQEMSARVQACTTEAAREALQQLMELSPEEVRPSIRMQLYALDTPASVQNFRAAGATAGA